MQPRVLLTALALVVFLIVGALMILGDPDSPVLPDAPTVLPETPVDVEVLPEITVDRERDPELPEISAAGRGVITGSVFSGADSTLPADLMVKLVRFDWPGGLAGQARIDATQLVTLEGDFGLRMISPWSANCGGSSPRSTEDPVRVTAPFASKGWLPAPIWFVPPDLTRSGALLLNDQSWEIGPVGILNVKSLFNQPDR